jgi:peptide/nickel transport system substrate-binding protein
MMKNLTTILIISTLFLLGCKDKLSRNEDTLVIHESADPETLNPLNSSSANARVIIEQVFSQVLGSEVSGKYNLLPILSQELPKISEIKDGEFKGGMKIEYEIRPEATWDNGTPITAHDYIFTIKSILNPKTNCEHLKSYYDWVGDIVVDSANPKKFTIYSNKKYFKIEEFSGYYTIPEYNYDPKGLMKKFTIRDMNTPEKREALKSNEDILNFASEFNSEKFQNDPKHIVGFGPYIVKKITRGQEVVIERKENWWGDNFGLFLRKLSLKSSMIKKPLLPP